MATEKHNAEILAAARIITAQAKLGAEQVKKTIEYWDKVRKQKEHQVKAVKASKPRDTLFNYTVAVLIMIPILTTVAVIAHEIIKRIK